MMEEKQLTKDLEVIETKLEAALKPVLPTSTFVLNLRQRLDEEMANRRKKANVKKGLLVAGGVVGGVLMIVAIIRSLTSWDELSRTINAWFMKQKEEHQAVSV